MRYFNTTCKVCKKPMTISLPDQETCVDKLLYMATCDRCYDNLPGTRRYQKAPLKPDPEPPTEQKLPYADQ